MISTESFGHRWNGITVNGPMCNEPKSLCRFIATSSTFVLGGRKKNIYISIFYPKCATCALFFLEELANIEKTGSNSAFSSRISWIEKNSWAEITDIDSGRRMITMMTRRVERDEFGITKFAGKKKRNNSIEIKLFSWRNEVDF